MSNNDIDADGYACTNGNVSHAAMTHSVKEISRSPLSRKKCQTRALAARTAGASLLNLDQREVKRAALFGTFQ
jgi:hypothetical protein